MPEPADLAGWPAAGTTPVHAMPVAEVSKAFGASLHAGLTDAQARQRLARVGPNAIATKTRAGKLALLLHQLASSVVYLLVAAAGLALYFGDWREAVAVIAVLAVNTGLGYFTELRALRPVEGLRSLGRRSPPRAYPGDGRRGSRSGRRRLVGVVRLTGQLPCAYAMRSRG